MLAHTDPVGPDQLWTAWTTDPVPWIALFAAAVLHHLGRRPRAGALPRRVRMRRHAFRAGLAVVALAVLSPLDALSSSLASAHMVQHLLLTTVAAPLLVLSAPVGTLVRGLPPAARRWAGRARRAARRVGAGWASSVVVTASLHTAVVWAWHVRAPYEAALRNDLVHALEHAGFLATAALAWAAILRDATRQPAATGRGVLGLFGLSIQGALLGALLTFAPEPWYPWYAPRTPPWGLDPLADQQLAGVIMWVPGGVPYMVVAVVLLRRLITAPAPAAPRRPAVPVGRVGSEPTTEGS